MARLPFASAQTVAVFEVLLLRPEDWHYGYEVSKSTGLKSGTLYPILVRLAEGGLLESQWLTPQEPGQRPRHVYRLTAEGLTVAADRIRRRQAAPSTVTRPKWA